MKKKILTIVICAVVLLLPSVVAIISYTSAQTNPVTRGAVSKMEVVSPEGETFEFVKTDKNGKDMFDCFFDMNENSESVPALLSSASSYKLFTAKYASYNKISEYVYFFTQDPKNAFYRNEEGKYFRIDEKEAGAFLMTDYAACLFPSAAQPVLTVGETKTVLPKTQIWKFLGYNNEFLDSAVQTSDDVLLCDVSGGLQLNFDIEPDHVFVTMKDKEGKAVFEDVLSKIDPSLFSDNGVYDVTVIAKWYEVDGRTKFGEATYQFKANVLSPAVFYLNTTETEYGNFVVVSAKNIVDPSLIRFTAEPAIGFEPVFFEYGGYHHALVPFSMACEKENKAASEYSFRLSYGAVDQVLNLNVSQRKIAKAFQNTSLTKINSYRNETTLGEFGAVMSEPFGNREEELYWMTQSMLTVPVLGRSVKVGFGLEVVLSNAKISYRHEGVNYKVRANDAVLACMPGKVVYVGETKLSGKTIVIDHGGGLKSLYAHMNSTAAVEGDIVEQGQIIGIVGNTGFCDGTSLHFGLYVFDVPVRYYEYESQGITLAPAVAEAIGFKNAAVAPKSK